MRNISSFIFNALICLIIMQIWGCSVVKPVPVQTQIKYEIRDSINFIDSTVYHTLYKEVYRDYTNLLDTLNLSTSYADAKAYVDTSKMLLMGEIKNKDADIPVKIKWKEKIVHRDSIITKEVPVPVEVEKIVHKHYWYESILWFLSILFIGVVGFKVISKQIK